jgi:hypothetical protein
MTKAGPPKVSQGEILALSHLGWVYSLLDIGY